MTRTRAAALTLVAVSALAWPPSRRLVADVLITVGAHLDHLDDPPGPTPEQAERMREGLAAAIAAELVRVREGEGERRDGGARGRRNGTRSEPI